MALSIYTSSSSMSAINSMNKSNSLLSTAMQRLGTGKRINSAADDAAGLQIASRLTSQTNGMAVAKRNISDATSMLQTAEGAFDEMSNIMYRMKDLATQAANDTNTAEDRKAINSELNALNSELKNIISNTSYAGEHLFMDGAAASGASGGNVKFDHELTFQIGNGTGEVMTLDLSKDLDALFDPSTGIIGVGGWDQTGTSGASGAPAGLDITDVDTAHKLMDGLETALANVGSIRANLGASINRLGHTAANLANMQDNATVALGNLTDADYAAEATNMTRNQMLAQTSMSMLKQSNSMSGMVMSLLQ